MFKKTCLKHFLTIYKKIWNIFMALHAVSVLRGNLMNVFLD